MWDMPPSVHHVITRIKHGGFHMATQTLRNQAVVTVPQIKGLGQKFRDFFSTIGELGSLYFGSCGTIHSLESEYQNQLNMRDLAESGAGGLSVSRL